MTEKNLIKTFVNKADFTNQGIDEFLKSMNLNKNKLVLIVFNELSNMSDRLSKSDLKSNLYFYKLIKLVTILVNDCNFNQEEAAKIKLKIKTVREKLLSAYGDTYIKAVNTLDELVVDKNDDIDSLFIIIKELINRCEDTNIIKKFVTSNKEVLNRNSCELFDIAFNKALKALKKENEDIYYYITLLKIFYISSIDKQKYYKLLDSYKGKNNLFLRQMYMIIQGIKRSLSLEEINDKYGFVNPTPKYEKMYIPKREIIEGPIITIDGSTTSLHDDAISVHKDGNKYIVDLFIADGGGCIIPNSDVDLDALNNFKVSYGTTGVRLLHPKIEKQLSLKSGQHRNVIKLTVVLNDSGEILDYYLKENEVIISRNFTFDETDKILSGVITDEFSNQVFELFMLSKALENRNENRIRYWKLKNSSYGSNSVRKYRTEAIVNEFAVLYNYLVGIIAKELKFPFVYKIQDNEYISEFISKKGLKVNDITRKLIDGTYLESKYSSIPSRHSGLDKKVYTGVCNPLRDYPSLYNQYLLHQFFFKDIYMNFDYRTFLELIEYFNKRKVEIELYKAEYDREARIALRRKK